MARGGSPGAQIRAEIDLARSQFRWNEAGLEALFRGSGIARDLGRRAVRVEGAAKTFATGQGGGPNVITGRLRGSITWRLGEDSQSIYADVGSNVEYAIYVEMGTRYQAAKPYLRPALKMAGTL